MKKAEKERISFRETFKLTWRSFLIMNKYCKGLFGIVAAAAVCSAITPYINIWLSAQIINELAGERRTQILWSFVVVTVVVNGILVLLNACLTRKKTAGEEYAWFQREKIYTDKMLDMDYASMDDQSTHDLRSQIDQFEKWSGCGLIEISRYFETIINSVCRILGAVILTVSLFTLKVPAEKGALTILNHPLFALAMIALMLAVTVLGSVFGVMANGYWSRMVDETSLGNRYYEFFGFMAQDRQRSADIRIYNQQDICEYYAHKIKIFTPGSRIAGYAAGSMGFLQMARTGISKLFTGVVYVFVCLKAWAGAFGVGSVTQYIGAITNLSQGISDLLSILGYMRNNAVFLKITYEFLDIPNQMYQGSLTTEKRMDRKYEVEFRDVSFKYPGSEIYALRHVNIKFKVGQRLAVVGMNGSGKTTFIKLLCRLYDPTEGEILLNGIDIRKYNYRDYMNVFSVVFQDFQLLALPLGQNVAAVAEFDEELVKDALEKAGFAEKLKQMPKGLENYLYKDLDKRGVNISGGEAQKIAIARTLYKDAPFIILDEPTAALDPIAEMEVYQKFNDIVDDKTAIFISHRLSSCRFCDEILVFHEGNVVQKGTHEELVEDIGGKYYELWHAQAQYYQENHFVIV